MVKTSLHTIAAILALGAPARGFAQTGPVDLDWDAPTECPTAASVLAEVGRLSSSPASTRKWHAKGRVTRQGAEWKLRLSTEVEGHVDEREFNATTCADLAATTAVILAIAVDPSHITASSAPSLAPSPAPATPPPPPPPPMPAAVAPPSAAPAPAGDLPASPSSPITVPPFALWGAARMSLGVLATPAFGGELGIAWTPKRLRIELGGLWFPSSTVSGTPSGTFSLLAGTISGCWSPLDGRVRPAGCVGFEGGALQGAAAGSGVTPQASTGGWATAMLGGRLLVDLAPHVALRLGLDLGVPFVRKEFGVSDGATFHDVLTSFPVTAEGSLGVEAHFP